MRGPLNPSSSSSLLPSAIISKSRLHGSPHRPPPETPVGLRPPCVPGPRGSERNPDPSDYLAPTLNQGREIAGNRDRSGTVSVPDEVENSLADELPWRLVAGLRSPFYLFPFGIEETDAAETSELRREGGLPDTSDRAGPQCREEAGGFGRSDRAEGPIGQNQSSTVEPPDSTPEAARVRYPACSVVSVAETAEIVEAAPIHSSRGSNGSISSLRRTSKRQGQDGTHRHAPRAARGDAGRWG